MNNIRAVYEARRCGKDRAYNSRAGNRSAPTVREAERDEAAGALCLAESGDPRLRAQGGDSQGGYTRTDRPSLRTRARPRRSGTIFPKAAVRRVSRY